jgi:hypothetical protein
MAHTHRHASKVVTSWPNSSMLGWLREREARRLRGRRLI